MKPKFEKVIASPRSSFKAYTYQKKEFNAPWHFHPEYELTFITKSHGIRYVGNRMARFTPGDLVLLSPNLPHCWKNTKNNTSVSEAIVIQWNKALLGEQWQQKVEFKAISQLLHLSKDGIQFGPSVSNVIFPKLKQLLELHGLERLIALLRVLEQLATSQERVYLSNDGFVPSLNAETSSRIECIQNFVRENYLRKITLGEIASLVCMTEEAFCRFFKRTYEKTFFSFLNEYKINLACSLLIDSKLQVAEVAFTSGYESLPYFYRQFQKFTGSSPLKYRQQYATVSYRDFD